MRNETVSPFEKPLSGSAKLLLVAGAAGTIVLFYIFITLTILCLLLWVGMELIAIVALARFGMAGMIAKYVERDIKLIGQLARSLWIRSGAEFRLKLKPEEAPGIVAILRKLCAKLQIPLPDDLFLAMNAGAWVELRGLRQNFGKTNIGIGYDLLAGLSVREVEAVLAHELVHAKLIHRFFKNWLGAGLGRAATVANYLSAIVDAYRREGMSFTIAEAILRVADLLTRWCARLVSAYSRQDEFEADHGAAELCGTAPLRSALQKLDSLHQALERLPWNERMAQIQSEAGLSKWLVQELAAKIAGPSDTRSSAVFNRYSTHPLTRDRIAALPDDGSQSGESTPGISLLADPDAVALKLAGEIERQLSVEEQKDVKQLRRWLRKLRRTGHIRPAQWPGVILTVVGIGIGIGNLTSIPWYGSVAIFSASIAAGWLLMRAMRYKDRLELPRPAFAALKAAWSDTTEIKDIKETQKLLEKELLQNVSTELKPRKKAAALAAEAYAALGRCDYLSAHVAARLCQNHNEKSVEGALALAVASAALHQPEQSERLINFVLKTTALRTTSTVWGAAWAATLMGSSMAAEALLQEAVKKQPGDTTLLALLALNQSNRNKLLGALTSIRLTCLPQPASTEHAKLLISLLLDRGDLREAHVWLQQLDRKTRDDREVQIAWIRLHLLQRQFAEAEQWIKEMEALDIPGDLLITIGRLYENARNDLKATAFFDRALVIGHYPEARLALARQAAQANEHDRAREHILAALDITKPLGKNAMAPMQIFQNALWQLLSLEPMMADCRAWIADLPLGGKPGTLNRRSMMVYARNEKEAETYLQVIRQAMEPDKAPLSGSYYNIVSAPKDLQPLHPVKPGVQRIYH